MTATSSRQAWRWVVYFVVLAALAGAAVTLPVVYNLGQQLRPEQVEAARRRWRDSGPADYDLSYSITWDRERLAERHIVLVRGGRVVYGSCEGEVTALAPVLAAAVGLPAGGLGQGGTRDVPAIFKHIDELLAEQAGKPRRDFMVAHFDPIEGYPRYFIHRERGSRRREQWDVHVWPAGWLEHEARQREASGRGRP